MSKHIHADLILQYAQDAMESETPWEKWEYSDVNVRTRWVSCEQHPSWSINNTYRRKPKTIVVNGFTVNAPMDKEPEHASLYFYPYINSNEFYDETCFNSDWDKQQFERGLCFANKKDAIAMAKAMLRIDPSK
jgi:hypothetical protein